MPVEDYFSHAYPEARSKFQAAAGAAGAECAAYVNRAAPDPEQYELATDVARIGPREPTRCLLIISGTHGVEGFGGSGCQVGFLRDRLYACLGANTCVVLVHALNPYGFAYLRRVNEDNVDLNRNCVDFSGRLPSNPDYEALHPLLIPDDWHGESKAKADAGLQQYIKEKTFDCLKNALSAGQYTQPQGLFYGGNQPTWSSTLLRDLLHQWIPRSVKRIVAIDLHTGLGVPGYGEPIFIGSSVARYFQAREIFGPELKSLEGEESASSLVTGTIFSAAELAVASFSELIFVALEFGTVPVGEVLTALRGDHWLHGKSSPGSTLAREIKQKILSAFYVDTPQWKAAIYGRTVDMVTRAARSLAK